MAEDDKLDAAAVIAEELQHVTKRRPEGESVASTLAGLAFSGGGIRSATFGLGVLETLKERGLLPRVDYLSTVSGGGYIGAWLTVNCHRAAERREQRAKAARKKEEDTRAGKGNVPLTDPEMFTAPKAEIDEPSTQDWLTPGADWSRSISHLRRYSNYLSPKLGFFSADTWSMGAIWIRNTLLVQLTVVLGIAALLLLPRLFFQLFAAWPRTGDLRWLSVVLFILAVTGIAGNQLRLNGTKRLWLVQASYWGRSTFVALLLLAGAIALGMFGGDPFGYEAMNVKVASGVALLLLASAFFAQPALVKLLNRLWLGDDPPREINYTQGWAQAIVVLPLMAVGLCLAAVMWGQSVDTAHPLAPLREYGEIFRQSLVYWPLPLSVAFISMWMLSLVSLRRFSPLTVVLALAAPLPVFFVLHALLSGLMMLLHGWADTPVRGAWFAFVWAPALVLYIFSLTVNVLIGMLGRQSSESVREWWSRLGAWLGIYGFGWMLMTLAGVYGPQLGLTLLSWEHPWKSFSTVAAWIATTGAGLLAGNSASTSGQPKGAGRQKTTMQSVKGAVALVGPFVFLGGLLVFVSTSLHLIILNMTLDELPSMRELRTDYWRYLDGADPMMVWCLFAGLVAAALLFVWRIDVNEFSLNAFYRSRLARCYLGATRYLPSERSPQRFTGFDEDDDLRMAALASTTAAAAPGPVHLINCALNLGGSSDLALHTRRGAPFTISPYAVGSSYKSSDSVGKRTPLGYRRTAVYGGRDGQTTVGQAISVSGAAASPNMGYHTSAIVAFMLTLFNIRLGWWFPSPALKTFKAPSPWFSLRYLLKELFGGADDKSNFLMISDGGHFENLAVYELLRRKCRVIIVSDAECDPDLHFSSLGSLIRMAEVDRDVNAKIEIDLKALRVPGEAMWSSQNFAVGRIVYGGDVPDGVLIYLKASLTGNEDSAVLQYKAAHPAFPHESTGDQFYGEDQFESYRRLGREIAQRVFGAFGKDGSRDLIAYAEGLRDGQQVRQPA